MCLILALWIRLTRGGRIHVQIRPFHVLVRVGDCLVHGTTKNKVGRWAIQSKPWSVYMDWLDQHPRTRVIALL